MSDPSLPVLLADRKLEQQRCDWEIETAGLLDPDQPTRQAHQRYVTERQRDFSPRERRLIRAMLNL